MAPGEIAPLELLDYSSNNVKVLDDSVFCRLKKLRTLNLWLNQINRIHPRAFLGLSSLQTLHLQGNKISILPDDVFANLTALEKLDLSKNNIKKLGLRVFGERILRNLIYLDLSNNYITDLHPLALSSMPFIKELRLRLWIFVCLHRCGNYNCLQLARIVWRRLMVKFWTLWIVSIIWSSTTIV